MTLRLQIALLFASFPVLPPLPAAENASNEQVLAAIQAAETAHNRAFPRGGCADALQIGAALPQSTAGFVVTEIRYDAALGQARFLLHSRDNHKAPPFYAWCSYRTDAVHPSSAKDQTALSARKDEATLGPVLVETHRAARLYLHSQQGSAVLCVRPLQPGHKDELIRVRLPLHGKMMQARVTGLDLLEAAF